MTGSPDQIPGQPNTQGNQPVEGGTADMGTAVDQWNLATFQKRVQEAQAVSDAVKGDSNKESVGNSAWGFTEKPVPPEEFGVDNLRDLQAAMSASKVDQWDATKLANQAKGAEASRQAATGSDSEAAERWGFLEKPLRDLNLEERKELSDGAREYIKHVLGVKDSLDLGYDAQRVMDALAKYFKGSDSDKSGK